MNLLHTMAYTFRPKKSPFNLSCFWLFSHLWGSCFFNFFAHYSVLKNVHLEWRPFRTVLLILMVNAITSNCSPFLVGDTSKRSQLLLTSFLAFPPKFSIRKIYSRFYLLRWHKFQIFQIFYCYRPALFYHLNLNFKKIKVK